MENNYNFHINPKEPSSDNIRAHMDFDALLGEFESKQEQNKKQFGLHRFVYIAGVAASLLFILFFSFSTENTFFNSNNTTQQAFIHKPLKNIEAQYEVSTVADVHQGGIISYQSGSKLVVPAAAFVNDRGQAIGGNVQVYYRELHDYVDFFVSGIPMAYDSVGLSRILNSSGMVEIYAEQNGERLSLAPGKSIQVELISEVKVDDYFSLPKYKVYQLDTANKTWQYRNIDMLQFVEEDQWSSNGISSPQQQWQQQLLKLNESYQQALADLQVQHPIPTAPIKPTQAKGKRPTLELDFQNGTLALDPLSQLQQEDIDRLHNGTIWEITADSPEVDPRAFNVTWESVRLKRLNKQRYELTLVHAKNEETLIVEPVLLGGDYEAAVNNYQADLQKYNQDVVLREQEIEYRRANLQDEFDQRRKDLQTSFENKLHDQSTQLRRKIINRFVVNEFGTWACGNTQLNKDEGQASISFVDQDGQAFKQATAYVVNDQQNTLYRFASNKKVNAPLNSNGQNLIWIVDQAGNISISHVAKANADGTIELRAIQESIESEEQLRKVLSF